MLFASTRTLSDVPGCTDVSSPRRSKLEGMEQEEERWIVSQHTVLSAPGLPFSDNPLSANLQSGTDQAALVSPGWTVQLDSKMGEGEGSHKNTEGRKKMNRWQHTARSNKGYVLVKK